MDRPGPPSPTPRALLDRVRKDLTNLSLPDDTTSRVAPELDAELGSPQPNQPAAVSRLGRVITTLTSAGALAMTGSALLTSLTALVNSFGELGRPCSNYSAHSRVAGNAAAPARDRSDPP